MRGSLIVAACFLGGIAAGRYGLVPQEWDLALADRWCLYILMLQVGLAIGAGGNLSMLFRQMRGAVLALPLATIVGTLVFTSAASWLLSGWGLSDLLAVGSGLGYYSLSSVLIMEHAVERIGVGGAAALGAVALLTNIFRELIALTGAPLIARLGSGALISASGVTSLDVLLPAIRRTCGDGAVAVAVVHGMMLELAVPLLVVAFCSL